MKILSYVDASPIDGKRPAPAVARGRFKYTQATRAPSTILNLTRINAALSQFPRSIKTGRERFHTFDPVVYVIWMPLKRRGRNTPRAHGLRAEREARFLKRTFITFIAKLIKKKRRMGFL